MAKSSDADDSHLIFQLYLPKTIVSFLGVKDPNSQTPQGK